ncbi:hypothetical protein HDU79_006160 [Rhizoclosmatium sp. JEL0117]|nr:hypothetical protein HDU79_006160 [Rhizoclosmatium sp. JEL0117]
MAPQPPPLLPTPTSAGPSLSQPPRQRRHKLSRSRRLILELAGSVPHIVQPSQWDCGLACVSMVLKSLRLYSQSDPLDLRLFVHSDAIELGSVWTIDLAYIFKAFGVADFTYYTTHVGVNFNYAAKSYYKAAFQTDSRRIHALFADAQDSGVRVVPLLLPLDDMKRFLMSGRYAVLMLVNLKGIRCRVCARRASHVQPIVKRSRWNRLGLEWLCGMRQDDVDDLEANNYPNEDGVDSYLYWNEYNGTADSGDEEDDEGDCDSGIALAAAKTSKQKRRTKTKRHVHHKNCKHAQRQQNTQPEPEATYHASSYYDARIASRQFSEQTPLLDHSASPQKQTVRQSIYQSVSSSYSSSAAPALKRIPSNTSLTTYRTVLEPMESPEPYSVIKTVTSTMSWLNAFVFRRNDQEDEFTMARSTSTTPLLTAQYEAALRLPPGMEITPPQISFTEPTTPTSNTINTSLFTPRASQFPSNRLPPGVGVVSTVQDDNCSLIYGNIPVSRKPSSAASTTSQPATATTSPMTLPPPSSISQPVSASTSPLRPGLIFASFQPHQPNYPATRPNSKVPSPDRAAIVPQFKFPATDSPEPEPSFPLAPSPSQMPSFLSFLTPTVREQPMERKHRAFSIPGTDSEKLAAVAAATRANTSLSRTAGFLLPTEFGNSLSNHRGKGTEPVSPPRPPTSPTPTPVPIIPSVMATATTRREEIFGKRMAPASSSKPAAIPTTSRRDEIFGKGTTASQQPATLPPPQPISRREEIFGSKTGRSSSMTVSETTPLLNGSGSNQSSNSIGPGVVSAPVQQRRGSLSFWDLRKRLLHQETAVDDHSDSVGEDEDDRKSRSSLGSFAVSSVGGPPPPPSIQSVQPGVDECDSECSGTGFESDEDYESEDDDYWSFDGSDEEGEEATPGCFGMFKRAKNNSGVFSQWFGGSQGNDTGTTSVEPLVDEDFEGHFILFIGYDAKTDGFIYRDPGTEERLCVMDSRAVEFARAGVPGSDHDVIVVRAFA